VEGSGHNDTRQGLHPARGSCVGNEPKSAASSHANGDDNVLCVSGIYRLYLTGVQHLAHELLILQRSKGHSASRTSKLSFHGYNNQRHTHRHSDTRVHPNADTRNLATGIIKYDYQLEHVTVTIRPACAEKHETATHHGDYGETTTISRAFDKLLGRKAHLRELGKEGGQDRSTLHRKRKAERTPSAQE
jgi:hypothetical protein